MRLHGQSGRKGFLYSLFAILILGLTFSITFAPLNVEEPSQAGEKLRIDEVFYFLKSITDDLERATEIIGRRAITSMDNYIVNNGEYLNNSAAAFEEAYENGTVGRENATLMNRSTINDWTDSMENEADDAGYDLNVSIRSVSVGTEDPLHVAVNASYNINLSDPISNARFDRIEDVDATISHTGMEDPLILVESAGRYANTFSNCSSAHPTPFNVTGSDSFYNNSDDWVSGNPVTRPNNGGVSSVSNKKNKAALVDDICSYSESEIRDDLTEFSGVATETDNVLEGKNGQNSVDICDNHGNDLDSVRMNALVQDAANATDITNNSVAVLTDDDVWQNNIKNRTESQCYFDDSTAPSIWDRFAGNLTRSDKYKHGQAFFIDIPELPDEIEEVNTSAVDYVYWNESGDYGQDNKIKGVTNEGLNWFRLDQDHVDEWNINALTFN
jgi:hypothetical protein